MGQRYKIMDEYHNPVGHAFDLGGGDEDRVRGEKILLYVAVSELGTTAHLQQVITERGMQMDVQVELRRCSLDESTLANYAQLWYVSGREQTLSGQQVQMIVKYVQAGNGLAIWADNDPYYADANPLAEALIGTRFSGNKQADKLMVPAAAGLAPGYFIEHPLTQGVNNLYEGITICTIEPATGVTILGQSHDGQRCLGCFEKDNQRVVLDTGFTKLYEDRFQRSAGIARYLSNIAFWLARGSRNVEYTLLTRNREGVATINQGGRSEDYVYTVKRPGSVTYLLQWEGEATLGLSVRDPHGVVVQNPSSSTSPLRARFFAQTPGDWVIQVKGISVPAPDFPYVLTRVQDKLTAEKPKE